MEEETQITCWYCGKQGHMQLDCKQRLHARAPLIFQTWEVTNSKNSIVISSSDFNKREKSKWRARLLLQAQWTATDIEENIQCVVGPCGCTNCFDEEDDCNNDKCKWYKTCLCAQDIIMAQEEVDDWEKFEAQLYQKRTEFHERIT